ncbi:MAG TPA: dihydrolipoamide acetyltransferase family protein [Sandaracinaceae bacterium LLY-WYZ-13_1]|nr:dihydrolipoamide acetyltransferase family protein [Sandaracinaceae bacterium LLY-WYZ-13_1]
MSSTFEFKLPDIGEGVMEGEIVSWLVEPGQSVAEDDPMVEVMTDKATVTIGAPKTGTIQELRADVGDVVEVGSVIVTLDTNGAGAAAPAEEAGTKKHAAPPPPEPEPEPAAAPAKDASSKDDGPAATAVGDIKETLPGASFYDAPKPAAPAPAGGHFDGKPLATPATRKLARDLDVDLRYVRPTGPGGRVTKEDVRAFAHGAQAEQPAASGPATPAARRGATPTGAAPTEAGASVRAPVSIEAPTPAQEALEERKPFVGVRRKIAERMQTSKNTAAHFTFVEECDVAKLKALRARLKPQAEAAGVKLTFLPFIVKACVAALKKHPVLNSALDERTNELVTRRYYNIGIAASTDMGLMVPVVKDADRRSILEIAGEIERLGRGAKEGKLAPQDLSGSTFTITSLGRQGGLFATPVLNFPEVGILGVHQIKKKPVVRDDAIEIGEVMLLSLSFDHRIVDGHVGAAFAYDIIAYLEDPDRLFLEMA